MIVVLGGQESRPVATQSVKKTPRKELLVELEDEIKRTLYKTPQWKLLYMCLERADSNTACKKQHE